MTRLCLQSISDIHPQLDIRMDLHIELCFLWALRVCPSSALSVLSEALKTIQSLPLGLISLVKIEELLNLSFFCLFPPKVYP
jgi:hypothetical protein